MKFEANNPPRAFEVGFEHKSLMKDCGKVFLEPNEQVTFMTDSGMEYDVARKEWGFYATPSINGRLQKFNLRTVLVKNRENKFFLLLVEKGKEDLFQQYAEKEPLQIVSWLDSSFPVCPFTGTPEYRTVFVYHEPPAGEIKFAQTSAHAYYREIRQFVGSNHFVSSHSLNLDALYTGDYVSSNYQNKEGLRRNFDRIINLDPTKSDNVGRVKRILEFANHKPKTLLDIGSGLSVFPYAMKQAGWQCTALDPDQRAAEHARELGLTAICGDFLKSEPLNQYDVITFNKVLEHVEDPITMLAKSHQYLKPGGFVYVELPDGEMAAKVGKEREEFFIDHLHIFSFTSLSMLADKAGFKPLLIERLQEPSTKYTLRAFLRK